MNAAAEDDAISSAFDPRLRVAIHQADSSIDNHNPEKSLRENLSRMAQALSSSAGEADLVVYGEGFVNGYQSGDLLPGLALDVSMPSKSLAELTGAVNDSAVSLVFGATTSKGSFPGSLFNSAVFLRPFEDPVVVDKAHLSEFRYGGKPVVTEKMDWATGSQLSPIVDVQGIRVAVEVCHDIVFPEVARSLCMRGAEVIVNVSAAVSGFGWFWDSLPRTRAFENGVWYVHATVVSDSGDPTLMEHSRVVDPTGAVVAEAPDGEESVLSCVLDRAAVVKARAALKPFTERRPDLYDDGLLHQRQN